MNVALAQTRLLQRRYAEALQMAESVQDDTLGDDLESLFGKYECIGIAKRMLGDTAGAREALLKAKEVAGKILAVAPNHPKGHQRLAEALAWLGEKDAAIAEAKRATELLPESVDAFEGPGCTQTLAEVYTLVGEYDKAMELLDGLLSHPSPVTVAGVTLNPIWDPVRQDPRFIAIMKKHGG
jgi:tetratricopeptide (TPR) repeat protein